jgi:outer membrane receptor for monomeric catechols
MEDNMSAGMLRTLTLTLAMAALCFANAAFAVDGARPRRHADPAAPYKANRVSSPQAGQSILDTPGQVTVLTRQILDDKNATSLRDALGSTAGVTVGR